MFGACCSGQPVTLAQEVEPLKYVINFANLPQTISHITIFMLPNVEFDPNYTALIYFQINSPNKLTAVEFKLLGGINLLKQSAIYKIKNNAAHKSYGTESEMAIDDIDMDSNGNGDTQDVTIGVSIEPNAHAELLLQSLKEQQAAAASTNTQRLLLTNASASAGGEISIQRKVQISNKIIENCYNYLSSFEDSTKKVPIAKFNEWWKRYIQKLENNPKLLDE